jgi:hypothetical protein
MTAAPTNNDPARDRTDAEQPTASGGPTQHDLPKLQKLVRRIMSDYPELSEEKATEMIQAFW